MGSIDEISKLLGSIDEKLAQLLEARKDHELRLKTLETMAAQAQGGWKIIILLASISGAVGSCVTWALTHLKS